MGLTTMERVTADPAAAGEILFVADEDLIVRSIHFTFVTDLTATNRVVHLIGDDGNDIFYRAHSNINQPASTTTPYSAFDGSPTVSNTGAGCCIPFPTNGLKLRKGDRLRTLATNQGVADNYSAAVLQVERL